MIFRFGRSINTLWQINSPFPHISPSIHKQIITQSFSNIPLCSNIQKSTFPTSQRLAVRPFSPERETFEPLPLSIQIHSVRLRCLFSPRYLYLHQKMYIYYFMLYLAESLTGRSHTEGKLLRYFPLWRERGTSLRLVESRIHYVNQKEWQA